MMTYRLRSSTFGAAVWRALHGRCERWALGRLMQGIDDDEQVCGQQREKRDESNCSWKLRGSLGPATGLH